jgi:hypothetical protein
MADRPYSVASFDMQGDDEYLFWARMISIDLGSKGQTYWTMKQQNAFWALSCYLFHLVTISLMWIIQGMEIIPIDWGQKVKCTGQ